MSNHLCRCLFILNLRRNQLLYNISLSIFLDIRLMEIYEPTALGGRTRTAKTLALKRLNTSDFPATNHEASTLAGGSSYHLQLCIRRLEKPPMLGQLKQLPRHHKSGIEESGSTNLIKSFTAASFSVRVTLARTCNSDQGFGDIESSNMSAEVSFGENNVYFELQIRLVNDVSPMGDYSFSKYNKVLSYYIGTHRHFTGQMLRLGYKLIDGKRVPGAL